MSGNDLTALLEAIDVARNPVYQLSAIKRELGILADQLNGSAHKLSHIEIFESICNTDAGASLCGLVGEGTVHIAIASVWARDSSSVDNAPVIPLDPWAKLDPPLLPKGLLPDVIERFARDQGEMMGADPAGLAMAALCVCASAIPDSVELQVKQHDRSWKESARLWVAMVGDPSTKKSPIIRQASRPIVRMDGMLVRKYAAQKAEYDKLSADERKKVDPPKKERMRIEDTTVEGAQEILKDSHKGVLCLQDELSGWFGGMDKYSGNGKGAQRDRAFWLQSFNGGEAVFDRVSRGTCLIPNLSISLLGGIQPEPLRRIMGDTVDDGLVQRLLVVMLRPANAGKDEQTPDSSRQYEDMVERLAGKQSLGWNDCPNMTVTFSDKAQVIRRRLEQRHIDLQICSGINPKLSAHFGKCDGIFARLCLIWHCIENRWVDPIDDDVAARVEQFLHGFLIPHAAAFHYSISQPKEHDILEDVAGFILAHRLEVITNRDLARGVRSTKGMDRIGIADLFERMDALGWVEPEPGPRPSSPPYWHVNPECHRLFAERATKEKERRERVRETLHMLSHSSNTDAN